MSNLEPDRPGFGRRNCCLEAAATAGRLEDLERIIERLAQSESPTVREVVARTGEQAERLINDSHKKVRLAVVDASRHREQWADHPDPLIRERVATFGHCLEQLAGDPDPDVRISVALWGVHLERLAADGNPRVAAVARRVKQELTPEQQEDHND